MRYLRRLHGVNPSKGEFLSVSIPKAFVGLFRAGDLAAIEELPDKKGIAVRPVRIEPVV